MINKDNIIIGFKFNKLLVISFSHIDKYRMRHYNCQCDCGNKKIICGRNLRNNKSKSCGCLAKENIKKVALKFNKLKIKNKASEFFLKSKSNHFIFKDDYDLNTFKFIYKITNTINNKIYIGKTERTLKLLLNRYLYNAQYIRNTQYIYRTIRKYGYGNFKFEIIYIANELDNLSKIEIDYIKQEKSNDLKIGYNLTIGGEGIIGYKLTPKQLITKSLRSKGRFLGNKNPFYGKTHSEETKLKIIESNKRRKIIYELINDEK